MSTPHSSGPDENYGRPPESPYTGGYGSAPGAPGADPGYSGNGIPGRMQGPPQNGVGTAALVVGILGLIFSILFFPLGILLAIGAIVLGVLGRGKASKGEATNKGAATAGLVMGIISLVLGLLIVVAVGAIFSQFSDTINECAELSGVEQEQCIEEGVNEKLGGSSGG